MKNNTTEQIAKLQNNLPLLRKAAGWSTNDFCDKLDITKGTLHNWETKKTTLSLLQYIAIRTLIDYEIITNKNSFLDQLVHILLDDNTITTEESKKMLEVLSAAALGGASLATISAVLPGIGIPLVACNTLKKGKKTNTNLSWMSNLF